MIEKIRAFYNRHDPAHEEIKEMLKQTGIPYRLLPTSGPYMLSIVHDDHLGSAFGPTQIKGTLAALIQAHANSA